MKEIDINSWKRRSHFELFGSYLYPTFKIDHRLDMTHFMSCKPEGSGLFSPFTYLLMKAINKYEGFRIRNLEGKIVAFDTVSPSYTIFLENENFAFKTTEYLEDYSLFSKNMRSDIEVAKSLALTDDGKHLYVTNNRADLIYISCLPWLDFSSIDNPLPLEDKMSMSIPRLNWGKCVKEGDSYKMSLSVTVNHAYLDGYEVCSMINTLQDMLDHCEQYLQ